MSALGFAEGRASGRTGRRTEVARLALTCRLLGAQPGKQNVVVQRQVLAAGAGVALAAAAADQLAVDAGRSRAFR